MLYFNHLPKFFRYNICIKQILNTKRDKNSRIISVNNMSHNECAFHKEKNWNSIGTKNRIFHNSGNLSLRILVFKKSTNTWKPHHRVRPLAVEALPILHLLLREWRQRQMDRSLCRYRLCPQTLKFYRFNNFSLKSLN